MLKIMRSYLRGKALLCACLSPAFMFLEVFMDLQQPTMMSRIIDEGVAKGDLSYILHAGAYMVLCALCGLIGGAGCSVLSAYAGTYVGSRVRRDLFSKIQDLPVAEVDRLEASSLITRLTNDVMQIQTMVMTLLRTLTRSPMLCIGGIIMSFTLSPRLALILCVVLPVLLCCAVAIVGRTIPMFNRVQESVDGMNTVMRENLLGIRVIKTFCLEHSQFSRFLGANEKLKRESIRAQSATFLLMPIVTLVMNFSVVAVLWFGGLMEMAGTLEAGKIMAFVNYMIQISNAMLMMVNFVVNISRAQASARRVDEVLCTEIPAQPEERVMLSEGLTLEFRDVSFGYSTGEYALKHISFCALPGERIGVIGATGSGKSTLAALAARLYDASKGEVLLGGRDVRTIPVRQLREKVGLVLQESILFSGTVRENICLGRPDAPDAAVEEALDAAQALSFLMEKPGGISGHVEQRGKNFSGGQKQRLNIARTLLLDTPVLILDDATSALDLTTEAQLWERLNASRQGRTTLIVAQRISSIMDCDKILVLDNGRIEEMGTHRDLMEKNGIYRAIAVSQLGEEAAKA